MDMQVIAGAPTQETAYRQFDTIIADLNYQLLAEMLTIDHDTPWRSGQDLGGAS
jgi:iron complex outermembrane receptor protein